MSDSMQVKLKELYKQLLIPRAAWMGDRMELAIQDFYVELKLESSEKIIYHDKLFDNMKSKRTLIEGLPGFGKTTLATKITYDWAVNEKYTQQFDLVFLLTLRGLEDKSVINELFEIVNTSGYEKPEEVYDRIEKEEDKILLILDGLDEVTVNVRDTILRILYKKEMKQMTVVVTCRTSEFSLEPKEHRAIFRGMPIKTDFSDQRVTVLGITEERKEEFLEKFLHDTKSVDQVIGYLQTLTERVEEFFNSPLMLILLADMVVGGEPIGPITSMTNFFKDVINFMIRRSEERNDVFLPPSFSVFDAKNRENGAFKTKLTQFGYQCFKRICTEDVLEFKNDELIQNIHRMGLVIQQKKLSNIGCKYYYQIYHRIIMEFMAAYYMWDEFLRNDSVFSYPSKQKLLEDVVYFGETSMVTPFLIGLMKDKAEIYFNLMSKHNALFDVHEVALWRMLMECEHVDKIRSSLTPILPSTFHRFISKNLRNFYSSVLHEQLVRLAVTSGRLKCVIVNENLEFGLPTDIELPYICLLDTPKDINAYDSPLPLSIKCDTCFIQNHRLAKALTLNECFTSNKNVSARKFVFNCVNNNFNGGFFCNIGWPHNVEINKIVYDTNTLRCLKLERRKAIFESICNILDTFQVNGLICKSYDENEITELLSHCKNVKRLYLKSYDSFSISVDALFLDNEWEYISLHNIHFTPPATGDFYTCKKLKIDLNLEGSFVLSKMSMITYLECSCFALIKQTNSPSLWPCCETITEIVVSLLETASFTIKFWEIFHAFRNLKSLTLKKFRLDYANKKSGEIFSSLLQLPIDRLTIEFAHSENIIASIENFHICMQSRRNTNLKTLVVKLDSNTGEEIIRKCQEIIMYCAEEKMGLEKIELWFRKDMEGIFKIHSLSGVDVTYSFEQEFVHPYFEDTLPLFFKEGLTSRIVKVSLTPTL